MAFNFDFERSSDSTLLHDFFVGLEALLDALVTRPEEYPGEIRLIPETREPIFAAWVELSEFREFEHAHFAIESGHRATFQRYGLGGMQLRAKLRVLSLWWDRFLGGAEGAIRRLLALINSILGSFVAATGAAEPIKEFKELIEAALDD